MINKILRDLINKGKVTVFIDNVLVRTETKKKHNKIVKEVLRRLKENNLYIRLEKYMWKTKKMPFLEIKRRSKDK